MRFFWAVLFLFLADSAYAQDQITITTPSQTITDGFSESMGIGFGFSGPGFFFNNGMNGPVTPFGPVPNVASFGGSARLGSLNFRWNIFGGQSSHRSMVTAAPSVTVMNGASGFFSSTSQRPFVTGIVPIVSDAVSPIDLSLDRLAATGGLERAIQERRAARRRAEEAEERRQQQQLPPLQKEDDPPLILDGGDQ